MDQAAMPGNVPPFLVSCPTNLLHQSVIPSGAKRSGSTLCFQRPIPITQDFPYALYFCGRILGVTPARDAAARVNFIHP